MTSEKTHLVHNDVLDNLTYDGTLDTIEGHRNGTTEHTEYGSENSKRTEFIGTDQLLVENEESTQEKGRITSFQALIHIVRCHAGSGLLGAAKAVNNAGFWVGMCLFIVSGVLVLSGMHIILGCARLLKQRLSVETATWNYQEIVEQSFLNGHAGVRKFAGAARFAAVFFSTLLQFGVCSFFFVVVGDDVKQLVEEHTDVVLNVRLYMFFMLILLVPSALIKRLDILAIFSAIANVLFGASLLVILGYVVVDLPPVSSRPAFNSWATLPLFFGQALLTLEGIAVVVPVQNKMKTPESFPSWFGVLNVGLGCVITIVTVIGCLGYLKYGPDTETNILLNLPPGEWLSVTAKVMLPISIILTYPIQFYFIFVMIWPPCASRVTSPWLLEYGEYIQRVVVLILTFGCAVSVPHLDLLMSLFGAACCTFLGFIIPAAADLALHTAREECLTLFRFIQNTLFIVLGLIFFFSGTYFAMKDIIATF